ncbi:hypothetical protein AwDysgo_21610 [Bacteroidales bacterium]|nr:hypothetical protein AwDysgo_21610 [Bacteroidales bacterium]
MAQAQSHYKAKEYFAAKSCLDSLKAGYPKQIAEQKQALQLMRRINLS